MKKKILIVSSFKLTCHGSNKSSTTAKILKHNFMLQSRIVLWINKVLNKSFDSQYLQKLVQGRRKNIQIDGYFRIKLKNFIIQELLRSFI